MVMAGNEGTPATLADDALSARLQWLRQRREALQEKLTQKNNELKNLCVEEAEITGVLPPEIPLEPGESPPTFRRRVGSALMYPTKLINKLKTIDTEESELELERQVQLGIVEAALEVVNDPTESKATRRKHRLAYQQGQRRLQELETELNFIRQSRGKVHRQTTQLPVTGMQGGYNTHSHVNVKHRTKKPRPPLDGTGNEVNAAKSVGRGILHETGISLSPLGPEDKCITGYPGHGYEEQLAVPNLCNVHHHTYPGVSPVESANIKIVEHDHNDNQNIYILPDQYRARTYSHGSGGSRGHRDHCQDFDRTYRPYVPNTYTDDERQMRYRQFQQQQQYLQKQQLHEHMAPPPNYRLQYGSVEYKHLDNADIVRRSSQISYDRDFRASHYAPVTDYQIYYKNSTQPVQRRPADRDSSSSSSSGKNTLRHTGAPMIDGQLPAGYWIRQDDDIVWVSMDEPAMPTDRFGSLDRRRRNAQHNVGVNPDAQSRYRTVALAGTKSAVAAPSTSVSSSSHQHHSVHLLPLSEQQMPPVNNKMLLRTQSLGSVETWQSSHSHDSHDGKDITTTTEYTNRKSRQKEWYETSLDSGVSVGLDQNLIAVRKNAHYQSSPPPARIKTVGNEGAKDDQMMVAGPSMSPVNRQKRDKLEERQHMLQQPHTRYEQPATRPKVLEIPAESKPSHDVCDDTTVRPPLGSPQNCTVVQAGKYQPYREVTKPFEMSDFYKYSTKFRKRNEAVGSQQLGNDSPLQENRPVGECAPGTGDLSKDSNAYSYGQNGGASVTASPVQRRIYQPVQRMTCQPYLASLR
ncbi:PREDICTED: uncharacterized protein LOC106741938 [Dinoponera quadriceps]|uniref:Uncharacterized protein LOC106741938 n=1 Tax=Dinoponera quadriceps TaxID=609295 RepID=A0A6P3WUP4_DINQU|nr:PREDICTED: uncharacterized protein LOC106741938 [Dinoponera quadriceps]